MAKKKKVAKKKPATKATKKKSVKKATTKKKVTKKTASKKKPVKKAAKPSAKKTSEKPALKKSKISAKASSLEKKKRKTLSKSSESADLTTPKKSAAPQATYKGSIPLSNPYSLFEEIWSPKEESFFSALRRLFSEYEVPGKNDEEKQKNSASIIERIEAGLRKAPTPEDLTNLIAERFDSDRLRKLLSIFEMKPRSTIRLNFLKVDIHGFAQSKIAKDLKAQRCELSPFAFDVKSEKNPIELEAYQRGLFDVEDEASQFASLLVNARPGQRILDMCARDGDHTLSISAMMKNKGSLFVYDAEGARLAHLKERAKRAGVDNIRVLSDTQVGEVKSLDAVLVDAPCSGTGALARQPEIKWRFNADELPRIHKVQAALIREGARKLKLGGRLVYTTNSLSRSENEDQVENFLRQAHSSYRLVPMKEYFMENIYPYLKNFYHSTLTEEQVDSMFEDEAFLTLLPDIHGTNGMFAAMIERTRISS